MENNYKKRQKKVFEKISAVSDAFFITNLKNIKYLTGFTGSFAFVLLLDRICFLFVDFRYFQQAKKEAFAEIVLIKNSLMDSVMKFINEKQIKRLSFEVSCTYEVFLKLSDNSSLTMIPQHYIIEQIRAVKDEEEIKNIKKAVKKAERAFLKIKHLIKKGVQEKEIAKALENALKDEDCRSLPFPPIVASGPNSSMPHWRCSNRKLQNGDFVVIDWGGEHNGYFSDMTRTFIIGKASEKKAEIYEIVNKARYKAIKACKAGIAAKDIDAEARNLIKQFGYESKFGHATGHGVGLDIHEFPRINEQSDRIIEKGMVFTVEPGIYIEKFGGVRIEDMVLVKDDAAEVLTSLPRKLEVLN